MTDQKSYTNGMLAPRPPYVYPPNSSLATEPASKRPKLSSQPSNINPYTSHHYQATFQSPQVQLQYQSTSIQHIAPNFAPAHHFQQPLTPATTAHPSSASMNPNFTSSAMTPNPAGLMGPPEKPKAEKQLDINSQNDVVMLAGVDLKQEQDYVMEAYRHPHSQTTAVNSFESQNAWPSAGPHSFYEQWTNSPAAAQLSQAAKAHGPLAQPVETLEMLKAEANTKAKAIAHTQASLKSNHLRNPFVNANSVRLKLEQKTVEFGIKYLDESTKLPREVQAHDFEHNSRRWKLDTDMDLVAANTTIVSADSSLPNLITLLSLAAENRVRDLLEDAYATARARHYGSGGQVPPEWLTISSGDVNPQQITVKPQSISKTEWDALPTKDGPSPSVPAKRKHDASEPNSKADPLTPPPEADLPPVKSHRYPPKIPEIFRKIAEKDLENEMARLARRKKRKDALEGLDKASEIAAAVGSEVSTPLPEIKITKKEQNRQAKLGLTEEVLQRNANETANMALGGRSKFSWLNAATASRPSQSFTAGAGIREKLANKSKPVPAIPKEPAGLESKYSYRKFGLLEEAPGITTMDLLNALEKSGKQKKTIVRAYAKIDFQKIDD